MKPSSFSSAVYISKIHDLLKRLQSVMQLVGSKLAACPRIQANSQRLILHRSENLVNHAL